MGGLPVTPADLACDVLSGARASQIFPTLGVSVIEHVTAALVDAGQERVARIAYRLADGRVEVHCYEGLDFDDRELLYRDVLQAALDGLSALEGDWSGVETCPDGVDRRWCDWWRDLEPAHSGRWIPGEEAA